MGITAAYFQNGRGPLVCSEIVSNSCASFLLLENGTVTPVESAKPRLVPSGGTGTSTNAPRNFQPTQVEAPWMHQKKASRTWPGTVVDPSGYRDTSLYAVLLPVRDFSLLAYPSLADWRVASLFRFEGGEGAWPVCEGHCRLWQAWPAACRPCHQKPAAWSREYVLPNQGRCSGGRGGGAGTVARSGWAGRDHLTRQDMVDLLLFVFFFWLNYW